MEASKKDVDILLIQEHNLTAGDKELVAKTARERGYHHCVGYVNRHGGSAVFASMTTFPIIPPPLHACIALMNRRVTAMELERQEGDALRVASMYVPVQPRERLQFLAKLKKKTAWKAWT